jgi:hypothetical protein
MKNNNFFSRFICNIRGLMLLTAILLSGSCTKYLDIVPDDGIATLETAFAMRSEAERYLFTCYSYMPHDGVLWLDPALLGGDEMWSIVDCPIPSYTFPSDAAFRIARGFQTATSPLCNQWNYLYQGLRVCNIFLENIDKVPDLSAIEKERWVAEVTFLKAYYHFYLVRMYGPVPLIKENLPIDAPPDMVKVSRNTVDECFDYIVSLLDEALPHLPPAIINPAEEAGRITRSVAAALKAKVLVTAASPLFNGNSDQISLKNKDRTPLFNPDVSAEKWEAAVAACREAITVCHDAGYRLYQYETANASVALNDTIKQEMTIRHGFCERWNSGIIWANTQSKFNNELSYTQSYSPPNLSKSQYPDNESLRAQLQPPLKIATLYYTNHGVPIEEDRAWRSLDPYALRVGDDSHRYYIRQEYVTAQLNFDREPRFYAGLGFDGGLWYGHGEYGNDPSLYRWIACRQGGAQASKGQYWGPFTGYYWKKHIHYENIQPSTHNYTLNFYPWPILRLADLYLLYAEAINEFEGPTGANSSEMFKYIDMVRENAGLQGVKYSWDSYTDNPKYTTQAGMRQIIQRERLIELSLEGQRFWDLRRWKEAVNQYGPVESWDLNNSDPEKYYKPKIITNLSFTIKDYFWPIETTVIENNPNIVQNIGW